MTIMNKEQQDKQHLGLFGIYKDSYKIILSWRKIFTKITLSLILPLSFVSLIQALVSVLLYSKILDHLPQTKTLSETVYSEWVIFFAFNLLYSALPVTFLLLATAICKSFFTSIHDDDDDEVVNLNKVMMSIVRKAWAALISWHWTIYLCVYVVYFIVNSVALLFW
ncbi:hypothetical protein PIB30_014100 [Stylosanthes scabra]|uniref:Uncharacterized protein n=1 Tax=Stylosanthes scabra TaxID=79078 RepID=A0ABU6S765_9FABA|nr:hypothetical protein [Stylosanthes scabra]